MVKKNKVVIISENRWEYARGGAELQLHLQKRFLRKHGHHVSHISVGLQRGSFLRPRSFISNLLFDECNFFYFIPLIRLLLKVRPSLVIHRDLSSLSFAGLAYCGFTKTKFVLQIAHEKDYNPKISTFNPFNIFEYFIRRIILKKATFIAAQSIDQQETIERLGVCGEVFVMRNVAVSPVNKYSFHYNNSENITIAWVANIKPDKNLAELLEFAKCFDGNKKVKILVIGKNYGDSKTRILLDEISKRFNIEYLGYLKPEKIDEILLSAKFLCTTSIREGFPNVFLNAWSYGIPVISTGIDPDGVIINRKLGLCESDLNKLSRSVLDLAENEQTYSQVSRRCIEYVNRFHSKKNFVVLHKLLKG